LKRSAENAAHSADNANAPNRDLPATFGSAAMCLFEPVCVTVFER